MFTKVFSSQEDYWSAHTLEPQCIGKHENLWTVEGSIVEDYYSWVNEFEASHPVYGKVWGDFEDKVYADKEEGYNYFIKCFPPMTWDYGDI
jgi:hypothetical protein